MILGSRHYSSAQQSQVLSSPTKGDCLVSLGRQLVAAQLNISCKGAQPSADVWAAISVANQLINSHDLTSSSDNVSCSTDNRFGATTDTLTAFNEGSAGVPACPGN